VLTIPLSQMRLFEQLAFERYQQSLITHIREHFPGQAEYLGEQGVLRVIQHGCELAQARGFETERDLCLYTDLTIMLGAGFDSDPQLEWAREVLDDPILVDPRNRMDDLWEQALIYLERVLGHEEVFPSRAYQAARQHRLARTRNLTASDQNTLISYFQDIWPEKVRYVGTEALRTLLGRSKENAARYGIHHDLGQVEFAILSFLFGHCFHADPLYPWVEGTMRGSGASDGQERLRRLLEAFDERLERVLV
jgi:hypothetical protein